MIVLIITTNSSTLMGLVHSHSKKETRQNDRKGCDSNDVYGGAILSDMHHSKYKAIRTWEPDKWDFLSLKIHFLHAVNNEKVNKGCGYMYTLHFFFEK